MIFSRKTIPEHASIELDDETVRVAVRKNLRAKNYRLSIQRNGEPVLTVPRGGRWAEAEAFLMRQRYWLAARIKRLPKPVAFADGAEIPIRGELVRLEGTGRLRGRIESVAGADEQVRLLVPGGPEHMARRLTDWLKSEAKSDLEVRTSFHAKRLGVTPKSIRMKGQSTRWGSCSSAGHLNYNWRLILAPPFVLDYVAAHEVAHLREMNHSAAFWALVAETFPEVDQGRAWLKAHGAQLMVYGLG